MGNQHGKERRSYGRKIDWDNAEKPSPPGKPYLVPGGDEQESDFITIRWSPPVSDGGAPILGYVVEHRRTGSPHWLRAIPYLAIETKLTLTGLEPGWRYQFRVSAENDIGRSPPGEISEVLTVTSQRTAATVPHFNVELQDTIALENEKVEFTVHVVAIPQAQISWYKDGFEVFSNRRMKIVTENDQSTFIIHQAALEDEGEIKCTATNRAGHSVTKAILKLEAPPRIRLPRQYEDGLLFEKGELVRLKVSTAGRPPPYVIWYHDGEQIQNNDRYEIKDSERTSTLRISEAQRSDRGEYQIKGINKIGEDIVSFLVTVTDRPLPPGKTKIVMALGRSVTLSWTSPEDDGGCKIGNYIVEYYRVGWNMWLKAATCRQLTAVLSDLIEGSEYKFRVKAENPYGLSEPSEESDVIFIPDPKRGILTPSERKDSAEPEPWQNGMDEEPQNVQKNSDIKFQQRRMLEENARRLLDKPLPLLSSNENTVVKPQRNTEKVSPSKSMEGLKRSHEEIENIPPPVPKRRHKGDRQRSTPSPNLAADVEESRESLASTKEQAKSAEDSVQSPREKDHTMFHGSSELMLVLLPEDRSKSPDLSVQQRTDVEMNLIGPGIAPPMSLSAPELGSDGPVEFPPMRAAVSSTELLHERTMIRLYQDAMDEGAQKILRRRSSCDRKSIERRSSFREGAHLEGWHNFKENMNTDLDKVLEEVNQPQLKSRVSMKIQHERNDMSSESQNLLDENRSRKTVPAREGPEKDRLSSVEREEMEFAVVRERIRLKNKQNLQQGEQPTIQKSAQLPNITISGSNKADSYKDNERMDVEEIEDEEEEDYFEEEEEEGDEDIEAMDKEDSGLARLRTATRESLPRTPKQNHPKGGRAPFAEEEDDSSLATTSRIVLPRLEITLPPTIEEVIEENKPSPKLDEPEMEADEIPQAPSKSTDKKGEKRTTSILKKLGLKREKKIPEIIVETDSSTAGSPLLRPILKNKQKKDKESKKGEASKNKLTAFFGDSSEDVTSRKKKQVRIAEPTENSATAAEEALDEEEQANRVLIYHYSDIVREFGSNKKPPTKLYLNCEDLKAVAVEEQLTRSPSPHSMNSDVGEGASTVNIPEVDNSSPAKAEFASEEEVIKVAEEETKEFPVREARESSKVRTTLDYLTDIAMFLVACWLYLFKNELYAVPVLFLMVYRQASDAVRGKYASMKESFSKRFSKTKDKMG